MLKQIRTPDSLVEFVELPSGGGVEVKIFDDSVVDETPDPVSGLYGISGAPIDTRRYEVSTDANFGDGMTFARTRVGAENTVELHGSGNGQGFIFRQVAEDGSAIENVEMLDQFNTVGSDVFYRRTVMVEEKKLDSNGNETVTRVVQSVSEKKPWGDEVLIEKTVDPNGEDRTTSYVYYEDPNDEGRYGKLHYRIDSDGSWVRHLYRDDGTKHMDLRPWKSEVTDPLNATVANSRATIYDEAGEDLMYSGSEERIAGTRISRTSTQTVSDIVPWSNEPGYRTTTTREGHANWDKQITENFAEDLGEAGEDIVRIGRTLGAVADDGAVTQYEYAEGTWDEATGFALDPDGEAEQSTTISGLHGPTLSSLQPVNGVTSRSISTSDETGIQQSISQVYASGAYQLIEETLYDYDAEGRLTTETLVDNGTGLGPQILRSVVHHDEHSRTEIDAQGNETHYLEDGFDTDVVTQKFDGAYPDIETTTVRDGAGSTTTTVEAGTLIQTSSSVYVDGELQSTTDELGRTTQYMRNGLVETETGPGGVTRITESYLDGQTKSVTGTGTTAQFYEYSIDPNSGYRITTVYTGAANSPRWQKTATDGLGRTRWTERPGPDNGVLRTDYTYVGGKLTKVTRPGFATQITNYDPYGRPFQRGLDLSGDGSLTEASKDRIQESETSYEQAGGAWWRVDASKTYLQDNDGTETIVSVSRTKLGTGPQSTVEQAGPDGVTLTSVTTVDRANGETTVTTTRSDLPGVSAVSEYLYGRLVSQTSFSSTEPATYGHDALGRQTHVTSARAALESIPATETVYNAAGQVDQVIQPGPNATSIITSYGYYDATHANAGQLKWMANGLGKKTYYAYNTLGQMTHQWGAATYPLRYDYNAYGEQEVLHTYRAGNPADWATEALPAGFANAGDTTTWVRDAATGLLTAKLDANGQGASYTYDPQTGLMATRTWARNVTTSYSYTDAGEVQTVSYSDGTPGYTRTYRRDGQLATVTDAAGTRSIAYGNAGGLLASGESYGGGGWLDGVSLAYPATDGRRQTFAASLGGDPLHQVEYGYDAAGRLDTVSSAWMTAGYTYEPGSDLIKTVTQSHTGGASITGTRYYDELDRLDAIEYESGATVVTSHDYTYDNAHRRTRADREDGSYWQYGYNDRGEVTLANKHQADTTLLAGWQQGFDYDNLGNRLWMDAGGDSSGANLRRTTYTANAVNQYSSIATPGAFDVLGLAHPDAEVTVNAAAVTEQGVYWRKELTANNSGQPAYEPVTVEATREDAGVNNADVVSDRTGNVFVNSALFAPVHDADGNLLQDERWIYQWDAENRLIAVETHPAAVAVGVPKQRFEYDYDSQWRRIRQVFLEWDAGSGDWSDDFAEERYLYDDWNLVATVDGTGALVQAHVWGIDLSGTMQGAGGVGGLLGTWDGGRLNRFGEAGDGVVRAWVCAYDGNGNVSAVVGESGKISQYDYEAFGKVIAHWGDTGLLAVNRYRFSTKAEDSTGLHYFGYRYRKSDSGTWISRDPLLLENGFDERLLHDGPNPYAYCRNDGLKTFDPTGLLSYKTTWGPKRFGGNWGTWKWEIKWVLDPGEVCGYVIQEIVWKKVYFDAGGAVARTSRTAYYEAWRVDKGRFYRDRKATVKSPGTDTWWTLSVTGSSYTGPAIASGSEFWTGKAMFLHMRPKGADPLPLTFKEGGVRWAGVLLSTYSKPSFFAPTVTRRLHAAFDKVSKTKTQVTHAP